MRTFLLAFLAALPVAAAEPGEVRKGAEPRAPFDVKGLQKPTGGGGPDAAGKTTLILDKMKITFEFEDVQLRDAIDFIRQAAGLNIVVDRLAAQLPSITLKVQNISVGESLKLLAKMAGAQVEVRDEIVYITVEPKAERAIEEAARQKEAALERARAEQAVREKDQRLRVKLAGGGEVEIEGALASQWAPRLIEQALDSAADGVLVYRISRDLQGVVGKDDVDPGALRALVLKVAPGVEVIRDNDLVILTGKDAAALRRAAAVIRELKRGK